MPSAQDAILVLTGGRVIDPANGTDNVADVVTRGDTILEVGPDAGTRYPDAQVRSVAGKLVTPGLIDIHTHCFTGLGDFCLPTDLMGVDSGVPIIVDAGTTSTTIFGLARKGIIDHPDTKTRIFALMDPSQIYLANKTFICHYLRIADDERNIDIDAAKEVVDANRDVIVGFKVRPTITDNPDRSPFLEAAHQIAPDLPIMIHLGSFPHTPVLETEKLLYQLRKGDIITHACRGGGGQLDARGEPTQAFIDAYNRGVLMDIGHSAGDFHFRTARRLIERGYMPNTISTDLNVFNVDGPVHSLSTTMSKLWALDVPLEQVIAMNTINAARAINREDQYGTLTPGRAAEVSVLDIEEGSCTLSDGHEEITADRRLRAVGCLRNGQWHDAVHDQKALQAEMKEAV
ncbi:amidohydrolase/deacetylase family metallohydrolase [Marinobacter sp. OP 3.4]|uniref:amidohydrolase/deacetylase family metallohydrolase n=1 Tax=Marinobacter sp. OP 3.4 TaxID=3076501 RepID=UPI002E1BDB92